MLPNEINSENQPGTLTEALFQLLEVEFLIGFKETSVVYNKTSFLNLSSGTTSSQFITECFVLKLWSFLTLCILFLSDFC